MRIFLSRLERFHFEKSAGAGVRLASLGILIMATLLPPPSMASPLETWSARSPLLTLRNLNAVTYGNGKFLAVGDGGTLLTSSNGNDWTLSPLLVTQNLNTVAFAAGRFLIGGNSGVLLVSQDGQNWTSVGFPTNMNVNLVGHGITTNFPAGILAAFGSTNTVGSAVNAQLLHSTDALSWTNGGFAGPSIPVEGAFGSFAAGNNRLTAGGLHSSAGASSVKQLYYTANGRFWTSVVGLAQGALVFGNGKFVLITQFLVTDGVITVASSASTNAETYAGFAPASTQIYYPQAACFGGGRFVTVGDIGLAASSTDGTNWSPHPVPTDVQLRGIAYGGGVYVTVGNGGLIASSPDAATWTRRSSGTGYLLRSIAPDGDGFVAVGGAGSVTWSTNGVFWETSSAPTGNLLTGIVKANGQYVATGFGGTIVSGEVLTNLMLRSTGTGLALYGIAFANGKFVAVGEEGIILTSSNGIDWLAENSGATNFLADIVFGNGQFVAVGLYGEILTSSNGSVWTAQSSGTTRILTGIAYGNGRFVAVGDIGVGSGAAVVTSTNGSTWENGSSSPGGGIAYGNGVFVVYLGANSTRVLFGSSKDGKTWTQYATTTISSVMDLAYNNGTFVGVGSGGRIIQSDPFVRLDISYSGMAQLLIEGPRNRMYRIQSAVLPGGTNLWQERTTLSTPPYSWVDPESQLVSNRAYRVLLVP
ncbi:MAG: hypothetical protein QOF48_3149 [Verrucomicrobiota bacterium]|jgi:hypothetical protein